jgi:hypothetical protein
MLDDSRSLLSSPHWDKGKGDRSWRKETHMYVEVLGSGLVMVGESENSGMGDSRMKVKGSLCDLQHISC